MTQKQYYVSLQLRTFSCKISSTNEKHKNIPCLYSIDTLCLLKNLTTQKQCRKNRLIQNKEFFQIISLLFQNNVKNFFIVIKRQKAHIKRKHQLCDMVLLNLNSLFFFKAMGSQRKLLILTQIMAENYRNSKYRKAVHVS